MISILRSHGSEDIILGSRRKYGIMVISSEWNKLVDGFQ